MKFFCVFIRFNINDDCAGHYFHPSIFHILNQYVQNGTRLVGNRENSPVRFFFDFHSPVFEKLKRFFDAKLRKGGKKKLIAVFVFCQQYAIVQNVVCQIASSASSDKKFFPRVLFFSSSKTE